MNELEKLKRENEALKPELSRTRGIALATAAAAEAGSVDPLSVGMLLGDRVRATDLNPASARVVLRDEPDVDSGQTLAELVGAARQTKPHFFQGGGSEASSAERRDAPGAGGRITARELGQIGKTDPEKHAELMKQRAAGTLKVVAG